MNKNFKITIITVCFNSEKTIEQTINSVINQSYSNLEYIIIDGASTDGTSDIIKKYQDNIAFWVSEKDNGIYDAMNKGIKIATGDYIQFLGADDSLVNKYVIEKTVEELGNGVDILSAGIFMIDDESRLEKYAGNYAAQKKNLYDGSMIPHPGFFVKREIMKENLFDTQYKVAADYNFFLQCYLNETIKFKYIDFSVVFFSLSGASSVDLVGINEHLSIMKKYNLSEEIIRKVESYKRNNSNNCVRIQFKKFLKKCGLLECILRYRGWKKHKCQWCFCRWCK